MSLTPMDGLFDRDKSVVSKHISEIYAGKEQEYDPTVAKNAAVQTEGAKSVERNETEHQSVPFRNILS